MRHLEVRIAHVELERVTFLAIRGEADALHVTTVRLGLVAIIAIQLAPACVGGMPRPVQVQLVIETKHVRARGIFAVQLERWMSFAERCERGRVAIGGTRKLERRLQRTGRLHHLWIESKMRAAASAFRFCAEACMTARLLWHDAQSRLSTACIGPGP